MSFTLLLGLIVAFCATLLVSALLSALETAIASLREFHRTALIRREPELEGIINELVLRPRRSLNQVILGLSVVNLLLASMALFLVREGVFLIEGRAVVSLVVVFGLIVLVGDLLPKLVALADPGRAFRLTVRPFHWLRGLTERPANGLTNLAEGFSRRLVTQRETERLADFTNEEIETLVAMRGEEGTLLESESGMIQDIIRLGNKTAKDTMTPRVDAFMLSADLTAEEVRMEMFGRRKWKAPIYDGSPDKVIGVLDVRRWLHEPERDFHEFIGEAVFVPETMRALDVFREHLSEPRSLVVVADEYGGVEGVLTHSDLIEELLYDEAPLKGQVAEIRMLPDGVLEVRGEARLEELADHLPDGIASDLRHESLDTIGGLIFTRLGEVPLPGTQVRLTPRLTAIVRRNKGNRIVEVLLRSDFEEGSDS